MATIIGETVEVAAVFAGSIRPVKFRWKGRVYIVREVTYRWRTVEGSERVVHFSVTDGATLFELAYKQSSMTWSLEKVE